jgi:hypothetical protein
MRLISPDSGTRRLATPLGFGDGFDRRLVAAPVFSHGGDRRRRVVAGGGCVVAASCVAYLAMVLLSLFASPGARPTAGVEPSVGAAVVNPMTGERAPRKHPVSGVEPAVAVRLHVHPRVGLRTPARRVAPVPVSHAVGAPATPRAAVASISKPAPPAAVASTPKPVSTSVVGSTPRATASSAAAVQDPLPSRAHVGAPPRSAAAAAGA